MVVVVVVVLKRARVEGWMDGWMDGEGEGEGEGEGGLRLVAALNAVPVRLPSPASELGGIASLYGLRLRLGPNPNP